MRIRALKPGFFNNEDLCALSPWHRLCFAGLWCAADSEGRIQDRPKRLKAAIFPYDDLNMDMLLWDLTRTGFIVRYVSGSHPFIAIPTWGQHQHPRTDEAASLMPPYQPGLERLGGPDVTTFPATDPNSLLEQPLVVTDAQPSLTRDAPVPPQRMGDGIWEVGVGIVGGGADAPPPQRAQDLIDLWNAVTKPPLPRCRELTDDRRRKIRARLRTRPFTEWREVFEAIYATPFYLGENDRGWVADFDWAIKNDTVSAKVLERARTSTPPRLSQRTARTLTAAQEFLK